MKLKNWAIKIAAIYALLILLFTYPLLQLLWYDLTKNTPFIDVQLMIVAAVAIILLAQWSLFSTQISLENKRLQAKRNYLVSAFVSALLIALLLGAVVLGFCTIIWGDHLGPPAITDAITGDGIFYGNFILIFISWVFWILIFRRYYKTKDPQQAFYRMLRTLMAGSVIELLVSVPAHIITRNREDCCAPAINMAGIGTGLAVLFIILGPGTLYLYARKIKEKQRKLNPPN